MSWLFSWVAAKPLKGHELNALLELQQAVDYSWMMQCRDDDEEDDDDDDIDIYIDIDIDIDDLILIDIEDEQMLSLKLTVLRVVILVFVVVVVVAVDECQWFHIPNLESEDILDAKVLVRDVRELRFVIWRYRVSPFFTTVMGILAAPPQSYPPPSN